MSVLSLGEEAFNRELYQFHQNRGTPIIKPPVLNHVDYNFYRAFHAVQKHGGFAEVNKSNIWRVIAFEANHPIPSSYATLYAKHYIHFLLPFERVRLLHLPDRLNESTDNIDQETPSEMLLAYLNKQTKAVEADIERYNHLGIPGFNFQTKTSTDFVRANFQIVNLLADASTQQMVCLFSFCLFTFCSISSVPFLMTSLHHYMCIVLNLNHYPRYHLSNFIT